MTTFEKTPVGRLIAGSFLLTDYPQPAVINLMTTKGPAMRYETDDKIIVDFPGEYDISGDTVTCFDAGGYLHYQLFLDDQHIIIIQHPALLEKETLGDIDCRLCIDESCKKAIERDELEGEIVVLTETDSTP